MDVKYLAIIDFETDGLGEDADVLEMSLLIASIETLTVVRQKTMLILPRDVDGPKSFRRWVRDLEKREPIVFAMHSKVAPGANQSLLQCLEAAAADHGVGQHSFDYHESVESAEALALDQLALVEGALNEQRALKKNKDSVFMLAGNSIANMEAPILRKQFPRLAEALHYRTMDASVLRTSIKQLDHAFWKQIEAADVKELQSFIDHGRNTGRPVAHRAGIDACDCLAQLRAQQLYLRNRVEATLNAKALEKLIVDIAPLDHAI